MTSFEFIKWQIVLHNDCDSVLIMRSHTERHTHVERKCHMHQALSHTSDAEDPHRNKTQAHRQNETLTKGNGVQCTLMCHWHTTCQDSCAGSSSSGMAALGRAVHETNVKSSKYSSTRACRSLAIAGPLQTS